MLQGLLVGRLVVAPKIVDGQWWFEYRGEATYGAPLQGLLSVTGVVPPGWTATEWRTAFRVPIVAGPAA
jgi:hypothetical protein